MGGAGGLWCSGLYTQQCGRPRAGGLAAVCSHSLAYGWASTLEGVGQEFGQEGTRFCGAGEQRVGYVVALMRVSTLMERAFVYGGGPLKVPMPWQVAVRRFVGKDSSISHDFSSMSRDLPRNVPDPIVQDL
jgi:hypothetical protein